jgi:hypothetical protein
MTAAADDDAVLGGVFLAWTPPSAAAFPPLLVLDENTRKARINDWQPDPVREAMRFLRREGLRPLMHAWPALRHLCAVPGVTSEHRAEFQRRVDALVLGSWDWLGAIYSALTAARTALALHRMYRSLLAVAWYVFTQAGLLSRVTHSSFDDIGMFDARPLELLQTATEGFEVVRQLDARGREALDAAPDTQLIDYAVTTWRTAVRTLLNAVSDVCGWTPSADAYLRALVLRYALYLQQATPVDDTTLYDDVRYCRRGRAGPAGEAEADADALLAAPHFMAGFLRDYALILYPALRQNVAARHWAGGGMRPELLPVEPEARRQALLAWRTFVHAVSTAPLTREEVTNTVRRALLARLLRPGEVVFLGWRDREPLANVEADQALFHLRQKVYAAARPMMKSEMSALAGAWAATAAAAVGEQDWESAAAARPEYESVVLFLIQTCLDVWWTSIGVRKRWSCAHQALLSQPHALPPRDVPPTSVYQALRACHDVTPILVEVDRVYAVVVEAEGGRVERTPWLVDALTCWVRAVHAQHGADVPLHPALQPLLK